MLPACREFLIDITFNSTGYWLLSFSLSWIPWYYVFWSLLLPVGKPESFLLISITYCMRRSLNFQSLVGCLYFCYLFFFLAGHFQSISGFNAFPAKAFHCKSLHPNEKSITVHVLFLVRSTEYVYNSHTEALSLRNWKVVPLLPPHILRNVLLPCPGLSFQSLWFKKNPP